MRISQHIDKTAALALELLKHMAVNGQRMDSQAWVLKISAHCHMAAAASKYQFDARDGGPAEEGSRL